MRDEFLDVRFGFQVDLFDVREVAINDCAAGHQKSRWVLGPSLRKIPIGQKIADALPVTYLNQSL